MSSLSARDVLLWSIWGIVVGITSDGFANEVHLSGSPGNWTLTRNGQPYFVRGAGGDGSWERLSELGGNSVRTWGAERLTEQLDRAQQLGLTVTAGIWLGQVRQGFDWSDAASLIRQREMILEVVHQHKNHPALLIWSLGNEMEDPDGNNGAVWSEINNLARMVKEIDPHHPTMTVIAELGGNKVANIHALCPDLDLIGINSYAGGATVGNRYRELGGKKPYLLTEFGPPGIWETSKNDIDAFPELTSTQKADAYRQTYLHSVTEQSGRCLGSYAFLWGQKQEVTATWFSLLLPDGTRLAPVDVLSEAWTGQAVANHCPVIKELRIQGSASVKPGAVVKLTLASRDPEGDPLQATWKLVGDEEQYGSGGDSEQSGVEYDNAIRRSSIEDAEIEFPSEGGLYRVFATVQDQQGGAAIANIPIRVEGPVRVATGITTKLPLLIYSEDSHQPTFIPSGWMGDTNSIRLDPESTLNPLLGKTALRCEFNASTGWGGVAWQNPSKDWGDQRGGYDLTGAKRLVFGARGEQGGEIVSFGFGLIGRDKRFFDTAMRKLDQVKLTTDWKQYEIPIGELQQGENLSRIKMGFYWTLASSGQPIVFYLDEIRWE